MQGAGPEQGAGAGARARARRRPTVPCRPPMALPGAARPRAAGGTLCPQPLSKAVLEVCAPPGHQCRGPAWCPSTTPLVSAHGGCSGGSRGSRASHQRCDGWVAPSTPSTLRLPAASPAEGRGQEHPQRPRDPGEEGACPWVPGLLWEWVLQRVLVLAPGGRNQREPLQSLYVCVCVHMCACVHTYGGFPAPRLAWLLWGTGSPVETSAGPGQVS